MGESFDPYLSWLGIRHPERPPNHYRLLGVELFEDDPEVLANSADRQMAHVRTFQAGRHSTDSQRLLNELAAAKICLLNADKKALYDADLRAAELPVAPAEQPVPPQSTTVAPPLAIFPGVVDVDAVAVVTASAREAIAEPTTNANSNTNTPKPVVGEGRSRLMPAVIGGLGVLVLLLLGLIGVLASRGTPGGRPAAVGPGSAVTEPPSVTTPDNRPVAAPPTKHKVRPKRKPGPKPTPGRPSKKGATAGLPGSAKHGPDENTAGQAGRGTQVSSDNPFERVAKPKVEPGPRPKNLPPAAESIAAARAAMIGRDGAAAEKHLALADLAAYPRDRQEVDRLQTILVYLNGFWEALRHGTAILKSDELLMVGDGLVKVVSVSGDTLVVLVDEREQRYTIQTLPPALAIAIAGRALPDELPSSLLSQAAFLVFDPAGDPKLARRFCALATQQGLPTDELREELKRKRPDRRE